MCCRNGARRNGCGSGARREAPAVTLGKALYQRYQEHKQQQQQLAAAGPSSYTTQRRSSPPPEVLEKQANAEILEKTQQPPSYEAATNGSETSRSRKSSSDRSFEGLEDESSDDDSLFEMNGEGSRKPSDDVSAAQTQFIRKWRANRGSSDEEPQLTRGQQWRAERAIQRAERAARKADRLVMGL